MGSGIDAIFFLQNPNLHPGKVALIEHDEDQHKSYDASCDAGRTFAILQWRTETMPIIMCRVNPNTYTLENIYIPCHDGWCRKNPLTGDYDRLAKVIIERYDLVAGEIMKYFTSTFEELEAGPDVK